MELWKNHHAYILRRFVGISVRALLGRNLGGFSIGSSLPLVPTPPGPEGRAIPMVPTQWDATPGERAYQDMVPISSPVTLVH
jgi:hypothetical protein